MDHSGPTIDDQVRQQEAAYYYIASANSQEAAGATTAQAVGALNSDLNAGGNIQESIPLLRGAGDAVSSTGAPSAEASADGQYTLLNATPGLSAVAGPINDVADEACPVFTNMIGAGFLGLASLGVGLLTGETDTAAGTLATKTIDEGAADAATEVAADQTADVASSVITKSGVVTRRIWKLLDDTVTSAGKITAMTILAKLIVMDRAMQVNSGFAEGVDLANEADSGGNIAANEIDRQGMYGAPLTGTQVAQSNVADQQYVASENSQKSAYQRYFALSNTDSLLSKFSTDLYEHVNASSFSSIFSSLGRDLNPISLLAKVFGSIDTKLTFAQSATDDYTYGNVQFGWSQDEDNLINSNQSYQPIENQAALDSAAPILNPSTGTNEDAEDYISGIYGQCFTDSIGTLLSSGLIVRDASGNVISSTGNVDNTSSPEGLCSPDNLGPDNPKYGDLVFRWRLAMNYSNTLDQLTQEGSLSVPSGSN
jgi:hypothetical protein